MRRTSAVQKLDNAYFELLETTHYSKITVSDIIRKSEISRTTFYRNYDDIFDMHKKIADRLAEELIRKCIKIAITNVLTTHNLGFHYIVETVNTQEKYILLLSGKNGSRYFFETLYQRALSVLDSLSIHISEDLVFRAKFIIVAVISLYVRDIIEEREHNFEIVNITSRILNHEKIVEELYGK